MDKQEIHRRWKLILGDENTKDLDAALSQEDLQKDKALAALYEFKHKKQFDYDLIGDKKGGSEKSSFGIARWLGDVRKYFPKSVVQVIQADAMKEDTLRNKMLLEDDILEQIVPDVHLVATLLELKNLIPEKTKHTARRVVQKVVDEILQKIEVQTIQAVRGALNRSVRNYRPRLNEMDWNRTILKNLKHYQPEYKSVIPERKIGFARKNRRKLKEVVICLDQSGSMSTSVVYSSIFAAVLSSIPSVRTRLIAFDTEVADLSEDLSDPVDLLFGVQLGGGTYIYKALSYAKDVIQRPADTVFVLISDLFEGGDSNKMFQTVSEMLDMGVQFICLLALSDEGTPAYDKRIATKMASLEIPVFSCTPDMFSDMIAVALAKGDLSAWAYKNDVLLHLDD